MRTSSKRIIAVAIMCLLWPAANASASLQLLPVPSAPNTSSEDAVNSVAEDRTASPQDDTDLAAVRTNSDDEEFFFNDDSAVELFIYFLTGQVDNGVHSILWILSDLNKSVDYRYRPTICVLADAEAEIKCSFKEVLTVDGLRDTEPSDDTAADDAEIWDNSDGVYFQRASGYGFRFLWGSGSFSFPWRSGYDFGESPILPADELDTVGLGIDPVTPDSFPSVGSGFGPAPPSVPETPTFAMLLLSLAVAWFMMQRRKGPATGIRPLGVTVGLPP